MPPVPALADRADACARQLLAAGEVVLASHIDADGLTSAAIASTALRRAGITHEVVFEKQLDADAIAALADWDVETVLFTDFGSGQLPAIVDHEAVGKFVPVVADHHQPAAGETDYHLNPLLEGIDGTSELSGAGAAYLIARSLARLGESEPPQANRDLAALAVVGAVGDMQAVGGELVGANAEIVAEGIEAGVLAETTDLAMYGRQTRPLPKLLEYASDVRIPGITNNESGAVGFLRDLDVELTYSEKSTASAADGGTRTAPDAVGHGGDIGDVGDNSESPDGADSRAESGPRRQGAEGDWRRWVDLSAEERRTVASALVQRAIERGVPSSKVEALVGTTYTLEREQPGTELRDASEFSTLLNATARYERADVGLAVCLGDRNEGLGRARSLLRTHRRNLSEGLDTVTAMGVETAEYLQYFDAGDEIRDTIVGIVAGMALGVEGVAGNRPIIAFARESETETKVSARGTARLVRQGLDLSVVMGEASAAVGGEGGGHDVAAGATIPAGSEDEFVDVADRVVGDQLG